MTSISHSQPPRVVVLSVVVAAFVTLASQVLVTRLLSALIFYHFSFLAISLALLGTGAGGLYTALIAPTSDDAGTILQLRTWTMRFAVCVGRQWLCVSGGRRSGNCSCSRGGVLCRNVGRSRGIFRGIGDVSDGVVGQVVCGERQRRHTWAFAE